MRREVNPHRQNFGGMAVCVRFGHDHPALPFDPSVDTLDPASIGVDVMTCDDMLQVSTVFVLRWERGSRVSSCPPGLARMEKSRGVRGRREGIDVVLIGKLCAREVGHRCRPEYADPI